MDLTRTLYQKFNDPSIAVSEKAQDWSYDAFARHAFFARDYFLSKNFKKILITLPQGFYAYTLMWGAYLAGAGFCPVNVGLPKDRKKYFVDQFNPEIVFDDEESDNSEYTSISTTSLNFYSHILKAPEHVVSDEVFDPMANSFTIFTSGSTGLPKGVVLSRKGLENVLAHTTLSLGVMPGDVWGQFSNLGFDLCVCDTFSSIICGATLVPFVTMAEKLRPGLLMKKKKITIWNSVPSVIDLLKISGHLTAEYLGQMKTMILAGERLFPSQLDMIFNANPNIIIHNGYGPTETTIFCFLHKVTRETYKEYCSNTVSIGNPLPGFEMILKDPVSGLGEIIVTGDCIGLGYLGVPENITVSPFKHIIIGNEKIWSFATGDYAQYENGHLYFITRKDSQIKIKGNRVDLSEIDFCLRDYGCTAAMTVFINERLISFVICFNFSESEIRTYLQSKLPVYYVPNLIIEKEKFEYNKSGKIDTHHLIASLDTN